MPLRKLPAAPPPPYNNPDDHAVVVGVDHYFNKINPLKGAINDSELFCRWLLEPTMGGLDPANVTWFTSAKDPPPEPKRDDIEDLLHAFFARRDGGAWAGGRRLYLFLAGHGLSRGGVTRDTGLVMSNSTEYALRGFLGEVAANAMRLTGLFREVMLVMDCCTEVSGPKPELECVLPYYDDPTLPDDRPFLHIHAAPWNATTSEKELDDPLYPGQSKKWQGVLTNALLLALTTAAAANGQITPASIKTFIESSPNVGTARVDIGLRPPAAPSTMVFGKSRGVPVNVTLRNGAPRFQVRDGKTLAIVYPPSAAPATVTLSPGVWFFDAVDAAGAVTASEAKSVREGGTDVLV